MHEHLQTEPRSRSTYALGESCTPAALADDQHNMHASTLLHEMSRHSQRKLVASSEVLFASKTDDNPSGVARLTRIAGASSLWMLVSLRLAQPVGVATPTPRRLSAADTHRSGDATSEHLP